MVVACPRCGAKYDDTYRWTYCPHRAFSANDGRNNFEYHYDSLLIGGKALLRGQPPGSGKILDTEWSAEDVESYVDKVTSWGREMLKKISEKEKECTKQG